MIWFAVGVGVVSDAILVMLLLFEVMDRRDLRERMAVRNFRLSEYLAAGAEGRRETQVLYNEWRAARAGELFGRRFGIVKRG